VKVAAMTATTHNPSEEPSAGFATHATRTWAEDRGIHRRIGALDGAVNGQRSTVARWAASRNLSRSLYVSPTSGEPSNFNARAMARWLASRGRPHAKRQAAPGTRPTFGQLQRSHCWTWLYCEKCLHHAPMALVERFQSSNHMGCSKWPHPWAGKSKMQLCGFMESVV